MAVHELREEHGYARVSDIAQHLKITKGSVSSAMKQLKERGYVQEDHNRFLELTEIGLRVVQETEASRMVFQKFLSDVLGMDADDAEIDACKVEHLISPEARGRLVWFFELGAVGRRGSTAFSSVLQEAGGGLEKGRSGLLRNTGIVQGQVSALFQPRLRSTDTGPVSGPDFFLTGIESPMSQFLKKQFLPLGLVLAAVVGTTYPAAGLTVARWPTQYVAVFIIFLCSGLMLRTDEIRAALSAWSGTLWGSISILLITPVIGATIAFQLPLDRPFQMGLALFCCMPTTLSSGLALTNQARGNAALALMLTVATNFIGIFTVPLVLSQLLGHLGQVELSAADLLRKLCLMILVPLVLGKGLRRLVEEWADRRRAGLTMFSSAALITVPWMKFSESSETLANAAVGGLLVLIVSGLLIHLLYLALNDVACRLLRLPLAERKATVLLASQKTLPVAMTVLAFLPDSVASPQTRGLLAIPCITFHLGQIFIDAFLATRWGNQTSAAPHPA